MPAAVSHPSWEPDNVGVDLCAISLLLTSRAGLAAGPPSPCWSFLQGKRCNRERGEEAARAQSQLDRGLYPWKQTQWHTSPLFVSAFIARELLARSEVSSGMRGETLRRGRDDRRGWQHSLAVWGAVSRLQDSCPSLNPLLLL